MGHLSFMSISNRLNTNHGISLICLHYFYMPNRAPLDDGIVCISLLSVLCIICLLLNNNQNCIFSYIFYIKPEIGIKMDMCYSRLFSFSHQWRRWTCLMNYLIGLFLVQYYLCQFFSIFYHCDWLVFISHLHLHLH